MSEAKNDNTFLIAARLLGMAADEFSNHGCNDLDEELMELIPDEWLKEMREWNSGGTDPFPETKEQIPDDFLMRFIAFKLEQKTGTK